MSQEPHPLVIALLTFTGAFAVVILCGIAVMRLFRGKAWVASFQRAIVATLTLLALLAWGWFASALILVVLPHIIAGTPQLWPVPLLVMLAYLLYLLRLKARGIYGCLEVMSGIVAIFAAVMQSKTIDLGYAVTTIGGVYIVVRGLDNFNEGLKDLRAFLPVRLWELIALAWFELKFDRDGFARLKAELDQAART